MNILSTISIFRKLINTLFLASLFAVLFNFPLLGQQILVKAGPLLPLGKELRTTFSVGTALQIAYPISIKKFNLEPGLEVDYYLNKTSVFNEHLLLYAGNVAYSKKLISNFSGQLGVGYIFGRNFYTAKNAFLDGKSESAGHMNNFSLKPAITYQYRNLGLELGFRYFSPLYKVNKVVENNILSNQRPTIYGNNFNVKPVRYNLSHLYFLISINLQQS